MAQSVIASALDVAAATPRKVRVPVTKPPKAAVVAVPIDGLNEYATICALEKAVKVLKEEHYLPVENAVRDQFVRVGTSEKKRPGNFTGIEGDATASCELKVRSSASELGPVEIALLKQHGIPTKTVGTRETIIINPAYADNIDLLRSVSKKLARLSLPEDFFEIQPSTSKTVVDENAFNEVFKKRPQIVDQLLKVVSTVALKTKVESVPNALKRVSKILNPPKPKVVPSE